MADSLGHKEIAALVVLMALGREVANPELTDLVGFTLVGKERRALDDRGLITSRKVGRALAHELTDAGWAWCAEELPAAAPARPGSLGGALFVLLGGVGRYLRRDDLSLATVFAGPVEVAAEDVETQVRAAYRALAPTSRDWVRLVELRSAVDAPRAAVDEVLKALSKRKEAHLVPESNRKVLTAVDHDAAIRIGGEDNHLISIEAS